MGTLSALPLRTRRGARPLLVECGYLTRQPLYRETPGGHWLPPEIVDELREFVAATMSSVRSEVA